MLISALKWAEISINLDSGHPSTSLSHGLQETGWCSAPALEFFPGESESRFKGNQPASGWRAQKGLWKALWASSCKPPVTHSNNGQCNERLGNWCWKRQRRNCNTRAVHAGHLGRPVSRWQAEPNKIQALKRGHGQGTAGRRQGRPEPTGNGKGGLSPPNPSVLCWVSLPGFHDMYKAPQQTKS